MDKLAFGCTQRHVAAGSTRMPRGYDNCHLQIRIGRRGSCAEIGVVATEEIAEGEMIAYIPRAALLTCANSAAVRRRLLQDDVIAEDLDNVSSWVPLLVAMLAEYGQEVTLGDVHTHTHMCSVLL